MIITSVSQTNLASHLFYIFIGLIFFGLFSFLDLEILFTLSPFLYVFSVIFLTLPFLLGTITRGSVRWIPIGQFTVQPSEIVKPFLAIISAWYWSRKELNFKNFFVFSLLSLPIIVLIFLQPDLGSTLAVLSIFAGTLIVLPIKPKQILIFALIAVSVLPLFWFSLKDYQKFRVIHFLNPYSDPLGEGYNIIQSKITVGSGGIWGRGIGRGTQSHLAFLPERHTDFIFASLSEELGLVGAGFILLLYYLLLRRILVIARLALSNSSNNKSYFLLSIGLFSYMAFQIVVNIGMNLGILPITGITLPLISYGGSSLLTVLISLGILQSIFNRSNEEKVLQIK